MREIVLDTETTGFDAEGEDRIIEIGCVELFNYIPTGQTFHVYINPKRDVPIEAQNVHGITTEFLKDKPLFREVKEKIIRLNVCLLRVLRLKKLKKYLTETIRQIYM